MKNYEAEGEFHRYKSQGRDMAIKRDVLLGNIAWHTDHAKTHPESHADTDKLGAMLAQITTLEKQIDACLNRANEAATLAGWATITRSALFLAN